MFKIQRIDVNNENAKNDFFTSFQNTGFAVMENHGISYFRYLEIKFLEVVMFGTKLLSQSSACI